MVILVIALHFQFLQTVYGCGILRSQFKPLKVYRLKRYFSTLQFDSRQHIWFSPMHASERPSSCSNYFKILVVLYFPSTLSRFYAQMRPFLKDVFIKYSRLLLAKKSKNQVHGSETLQNIEESNSILWENDISCSTKWCLAALHNWNDILVQVAEIRFRTPVML